MGRGTPSRSSKCLAYAFGVSISTPKACACSHGYRTSCTSNSLGLVFICPKLISCGIENNIEKSSCRCFHISLAACSNGYWFLNIKNRSDVQLQFPGIHPMGGEWSAMFHRNLRGIKVLNCLNYTKFGQLIIMKIIRIIATRCHILRLKCIEFDFGWGSAPDPAVSLQRSPRPLAGFKGPYF